jgi:hypothetical protein
MVERRRPLPASGVLQRSLAHAKADVTVADVDAKGRTTPSARSERRAARAALFIQTSAPVGLTPLGQCEIFERGRIAERNQDGAATLCRVGTVWSVRRDIPFRSWWI